MIYNRLRTHTFHKALDHFIALILVLFLIASAVATYQRVHRLARTFSYVSDVYPLKADIHHHYAVTGEWPQDMDALKSSRLLEIKSDVDGNTEQSVEDGAIQIGITTGTMRGQRLSLLPGVPVGSVSGPVSWFVGESQRSAAFSISGRDRTTVDSLVIPFDMK